MTLRSGLRALALGAAIMCGAAGAEAATIIKATGTIGEALDEHGVFGSLGLNFKGTSFTLTMTLEEPDLNGDAFRYYDLPARPELGYPASKTLETYGGNYGAPDSLLHGDLTFAGHTKHFSGQISSASASAGPGGMTYSFWMDEPTSTGYQYLSLYAAGPSSLPFSLRDPFVLGAGGTFSGIALFMADNGALGLGLNVTQLSRFDDAAAPAVPLSDLPFSAVALAGAAWFASRRRRAAA